MFGKCSLLVLISSVVLCVVLVLMPPVSGDCCGATKFKFTIRPESKKQCVELDHAKMTYATNKCMIELCGNQHPPTPCCGRGPCNMFCCNCDGGCHYRNHPLQVMDDFRLKYEKHVTNVHA